MTTKFGSFDQSAGGAFVQSRAGAFNRAGLSPGIVGMVWIDFARKYITDPPEEGSALHAADIEVHRSRLSALWAQTPPVIASKGIVVHIANRMDEYDPIGPVPRELFFEYGVQRFPTWQDNVVAFRGGIPTTSPPGVGRMEVIREIILSRPSLIKYLMEPGFTNFVNWLNNRRGEVLNAGIRVASDVEITIWEYGDRWILELLRQA